MRGSLGAWCLTRACTRQGAEVRPLRGRSLRRALQVKPGVRGARDGISGLWGARTEVNRGSRSSGVAKDSIHHRGNEHQRGVLGALLRSRPDEPWVALPSRPRLPMLLTDNGSHHTDTAPGAISGMPAQGPPAEHSCHCVAWPGRRRRGSLQPPNNALKLTGHCYDRERRWSPAA